MESEIWVKSEEKRTFILVLRDRKVHHMKITGLMLKRKSQNVLEALQQGQEPSAAGANSVTTLDVESIRKAEVSPSNGSLTLHGEGEGKGSKPLKFSTSDSNADKILQAILAQTDRPFQPRQEEIGALEALAPPALFGAVGGMLCWASYMTARDLAAGHEAEVKGIRRRGMQRMLIGISEMLGTSGTIVVGLILLALILGWAAHRIIRRPERTVWLPNTETTMA